MMENIKINITSNGTTTLATAGKYCERNVDIDVLVSGGGGGSSFLDSEGSLFMTADEEAFCVDGNDRMVDVTEFPEKPLDNVVYRKNEKTTTSDGQLTYINETTSYGIPVQTDHSNGLHYKNVEVLQYMGKETKTQAFVAVEGLTLDFMAYMSLISQSEYTYNGYKVVDTKNEVDKADTQHVYLIRATNVIFYYTHDWFEFSATKINSPSEIESSQETKYYICYGKGGWQSLIQAKENAEKYFDLYSKKQHSFTSLIDGSSLEFEDDAVTDIRQYAFYYHSKLKSVSVPFAKSLGYNAFTHCTSLETVNALSATSIYESAFYNCNSLKTVICSASLDYMSGHQDIFSDCYSLVCIVTNSTSPYMMRTMDSTLSSCYHFNGTVNETYNPEGLRDGYIYVPLSIVDTIRRDSFMADYKEQIYPLATSFSELYSIDRTKYPHAFYDGNEMVYVENQGWKTFVR